MAAPRRHSSALCRHSSARFSTIVITQATSANVQTDIPPTLVLKRHTLDYPDSRLDLPHRQAPWRRTGSHRGCVAWRRPLNIGTGQRIISNWRVRRPTQTCVWRTSRWPSFGLNAHTRLNSREYQSPAGSCKRVAVARRRAASDAGRYKKAAPALNQGR